MDIEINTENGWMPANIPPTPETEDAWSAEYLVLALNHNFYIGKYIFEDKRWVNQVDCYGDLDFESDTIRGGEIIAYYKPPPVIFDYHPEGIEEIVF